MKPGRIVVPLVAVAVMASAVIAYRHIHDGAKPIVAPLATPIGVTLQQVYVGPMLASGIANGKLPVARAVYANAQGMPAYIFDNDTEAGKSTCVEACAKDWPALLAMPDAKAEGDWTLIERSDGGHQWAFKGKPLYVSAKDKPFGQPMGDGAASVWHVALFRPTEELENPDGIETHELPKANGVGLTDNRGMSLYVFDGGAPDARAVCEDASCTYRWKPVSAPEVAQATGEFTIVAGPGGSPQWAFRGQPLFSFEDDNEPGDATGDQPDKHWRAALAVRYFMPEGVTVRRNHFGGVSLATTAGFTLYIRDRSGYMQGHSLRRGIPLVPAAGRQIGLSACDPVCLKNWPALQAPPNAQPSGFWDVATRDDGTRQWTYMGYPLFLYSGDKAPGDMNGNDIYEFLPGQDLFKTANLPPIMPHGSASLVWRQASP